MLISNASSQSNNYLKERDLKIIMILTKTGEVK